jgi:hypothetical protein
MKQNTLYTLKQTGVVLFIVGLVYAIFRHGDIGYQFHWDVLWDMNPTYHVVF